MKQKKSLIVLLLSVILFSCEETITDVELPYVEQLVVSCVLENGDLVDSLRLERTLPPLEHYDEDKALVKDAKVQINDGDSTYDLFYSDGYYRTSNLIAQAGKTYKLNVEWKGKKATATTFVPNPVEIPKIEFEIRKTTGQWGEAYEVNVFSMIKPVKMLFIIVEFLIILRDMAAMIFLIFIEKLMLIPMVIAKFLLLIGIFISQ